MLANYGYKDGSGDFFITIDTDKCNGCGKCVPACPAGVLELITDESDPFRELPVAAVTEAHRKKIKYSCAPCKPAGSPVTRSLSEASYCEVIPLRGADRDKPAGSPADRGKPPSERPALPCMKVCQLDAITHSW